MTDQNDNKKDTPALSNGKIHNLDPAELRRQAEDSIKHRKPTDLESLTPEEALKIVHELQVHQIELEMQNEELRRAQTELDASRARYFDLYDLAPVGYCTISEKNLILEANLTAANMLGVDRGALVRQPITRFILSEDQDIYYLNRKKLFNTSEPQECDLRMLKKDAATFWTRLEATLTQDADGTQACRIVISDITAGKKAEEALLRSEDHFKLLAETAEELIMWKNVDIILGELCRKVMKHLDCDIFAIYLVDTKAGKLHLKASAGLPEERIREIEWVDFGTGINGCVILGTESVIRGNISDATDSQTEAARALGIQAYACFPLMSQGVHIGSLGFGTKTRTRFSEEDVTLMKTVAANMATAMQRTILLNKIQETNDSLEVRIHERTADLKNMVEALRQSNLELEDFAHIASHDLQEPLRKIRTFAERLTNIHKDSLNDQERDYLDRMQNASARMQSLIQELVKYSRVASGQKNYKVFKLTGPVKDAVKDLSILLEESEGLVEIDELPEVEANDVQMCQLFENLISNALKYRSDQKPLIRIYTSPSSGGMFHEIHVEDNGIGFDEIYLDKIFKPFQRLHGKSSPYQGTGMGLAICRKILEHHNGTITARSNLGKGSTFIVRLPKRQAR